MATDYVFGPHGNRCSECGADQYDAIILEWPCVEREPIIYTSESQDIERRYEGMTKEIKHDPGCDGDCGGTLDGTTASSTPRTQRTNQMHMDPLCGICGQPKERH